MKTMQPLNNLHQYHSKCVCQICTCQKHHCPHSQMHVPFDEISSYQKEYHPHPLNTWSKPPSSKPEFYQPYQNINSSYKQHYPGHKPQMRQKIVPRVKQQNGDTPFYGDSEYKTNFGPKKIDKEPVNIKDKQYNADKQPFDGSTTYKDHYPRKEPNLHKKKIKQDYKFPDGYKFHGNTTHQDDFNEKPLQPLKSFKPDDQLGNTGPHDLNSIYRQDFMPKEHPQPCPILKMPTRPPKVNHPCQHIMYDKFKMRWQEK